MKTHSILKLVMGATLAILFALTVLIVAFLIIDAHCPKF